MGAGECIVDYLLERAKLNVAEVVDWPPAVAGVTGPALHFGWVERDVWLGHSSGSSPDGESSCPAGLAAPLAQMMTSASSGGPEHSLQWNTSRWE